MPGDLPIDHSGGGRSHSHNPDRRIGDLAERQHGVVARSQLLDLGVGRRAIEHRIACGRLRVVHRGVYAVGHSSLTRAGRFMAAVLAGGPDAVLSHRSAAALRGLRVPSGGAIEVSVPVRRRAPAGVRFRHTDVPPDERTVHLGVPVTTVSRTLLDLAAVLRPGAVERAMHEAEVLRLVDELSVPALIERHPGRPGVPALRHILAAADLGADVTDSELEDAFVTFARRYRLPRPLLNRTVLGFRVDALWPDARLAIELDGRTTHLTRRRFETDRVRDRALTAAGWRVVRVTWRQLHDDPGALAADLRRILSLAGATV